jgi:hypothetical protein
MAVAAAIALFGSVIRGFSDLAPGWVTAGGQDRE